MAERVGANKRQDEPRARKSTRIRVRAPGSLTLPEVRGLEKNLILDERAQSLPLARARARLHRALGPLRNAQPVPSLPPVCAKMLLHF